MFKKNLSPRELEEKRRAKHGAFFLIKLLLGCFLLLPASIMYEIVKTYKSFNNYRKAKKQWGTLKIVEQEDDYNV